VAVFLILEFVVEPHFSTANAGSLLMVLGMIILVTTMACGFDLGAPWW
jgi:hypothetical protein